MYLDSILLAIFAWVYVFILTKEGMILAWTWKILGWFPNWVQELFGCEYCVAGQAALWYYIYKYEYNLIEHILFITATIFVVEIINVWNRQSD